jgi:predicted RNase H-like HicB family nuclease
LKKPEKYVYPAIFTYEEDGQISVEFPDLGCATCADNDEKALEAAKELLSVYMNGLEEDGDNIPSPTPMNKISENPNERAFLIDVYMPVIRHRHENRSVSQTVTMPAWLNAAVKEQNINISQTLQKALINDLGLRRI